MGLVGLLTGVMDGKRGLFCAMHAESDFINIADIVETAIALQKKMKKGDFTVQSVLKNFEKNNK